jgi:hypothetical protein
MILEDKKEHGRAARAAREKAKPAATRGLFFSLPKPARAKREKPAGPKPATKNDPKLVSAARELRDRYLEHVNSNDGLPAPRGKYEVSRQLPPPEAGEPPMLEAA